MKDHFRHEHNIQFTKFVTVYDDDYIKVLYEMNDLIVSM